MDLLFVILVVGLANLSSVTSTVDSSPDTCRSDIVGKNNYRYSWFGARATEDPLEDTPCCENLEVDLGTHYGTCREDINQCDDGFTVSIWIKQLRITSQGFFGSYFLSSGAQRMESCGFYIRLNAINDTANPVTGTFDVAVASTGLKWQMLFVAQLQRSMHLMVTWREDLGLDIYVDGQCAGSQVEGFRRNPVPLCGTDDPFPNLFVGRRNDATRGFTDAKIGIFDYYVSWQSPKHIYRDDKEGAALTYYQGCISKSATKSILHEPTETAYSYTPAICRRNCIADGKKYAALIPVGPNIDCFCLDYFKEIFKVSDRKCKKVCSTLFKKATCGGRGVLSVYLTTSFEYSLGSVEPISEFRLELVGFAGYTVIQGQRVPVRFEVKTGNHISYFVYGDRRVGKIKTSTNMSSIVFPEPGIYSLTALAVNPTNQQEIRIIVTVAEDVNAIKDLEIPEALGEVNITAKFPLNMIGGNGASCRVDFGDGVAESCTECENVRFIEHVYAVPGVYQITMECKAGFNAIKRSSTVVVVEPIAIGIAPTFDLLYGEDFLVPFNVSGTNISQVHVFFDTVALPHSCDKNLTCQTVITSNDYLSVGTHILKIQADNDLGGTGSISSRVFVGQLIQGFAVEVSKTHVYVNESINITVSIADGTKAFITLSIGDYKQLYICEMAPCSYVITAVIPDAGHYQIQVEASNDFTEKQTKNISVMIYQPIPDLELKVRNATSIQEAVTLLIEGDSDAWPNNATASITINTRTVHVPFVQTEEGVFLYEWLPSKYGTFVVRVNISNMLQSKGLVRMFNVGSVIYGISVEVFPDLPVVNTDVTFVIGITEGNPVNITVDFGDTERMSVIDDFGVDNPESSEVFQIDAPSRIMTLTHRYKNVGEYVINVTAHNFLGFTFTNASVLLHRELEGLYLSANLTSIAPNENFEIGLELEKAASIPWNASCNFDFGDGHSIEDVHLKITHVNKQHVTHAYTEPYGNVTIHVTCSNQVSLVTVSLNLRVVAPLTNCALDGPFFIATNEFAQFQIALEGTHYSLDIDTGDGRSLGEKRGRVVDDSEIYNFEVVYSEPGAYNIQATAKNDLSVCKSNISLVVQNPILDHCFKVVVVPDVLDVHDALMTIKIRVPDDCVAIPSRVSIFVDFGDQSTINTTLAVDGDDIKHTYTSAELYQVSVVFKNLVSELAALKTVLVLESATDLWSNHSSTLNALGERVVFLLSTRVGTNVTYTIEYGDGHSDSIFVESSTVVKFTHKYLSPGKFIVTTRAGNYLGQVASNKTKIHIVTPIRGLVLKAEPDVIYKQGSVNLTLSQVARKSPPTEMDCLWNFGDDSDQVSMKDVALSENISVSIERSYPGGRFQVTVKCRNPLSKTTLSSWVKVYETISSAEMTVDDSIIKIGSEVTFTVRLTSGSLVIFTLDFGDGFEEHRNITQADNAQLQTFVHTYHEAGLHKAKLKLTNGMATANNLDFETQMSEISVFHGTDMFDLSYESSLYIPPGEVRFILRILPNKDAPKIVSLQWSFGDGKTHHGTGFFNGTITFAITHFYEKPGTYEVNVEVSNEVESTSYTSTVSLVKYVPPLRVFVQYSDAEGNWLNGHGPDLNWMPIKSELKFFANTTFQDVESSWKFGDGGDVVTSEIAYHVFEKVGWYNITLKMQNSTTTLIEEYFDLFIIGDPINLRLSTLISEGSTGDVWVNSNATFVLDAAVHPGPSCLLWDMGDDSPITIYGPPPCEVNVLTNDDIFIEIDRYTPGSFEHKHVYKSPGYYKVRVKIENYVSITNSTVKDVVTVKGCSKPIQVTFPGSGQNIYNTRQFLVSEKIPLQPVVEFPCVGIDNPIFTWSAYKLRVMKRGFTIPSEYPITPLPRPKRTFEPLTFTAGIFEVTLTVSIPGQVVKPGKDSIYLELKPSPLVVKIEGGPSRSVGSVEPLIVDGASLSYDPDNPNGNAHAWRFIWKCFRVHNLNYATSSPISTEMEEIPRACDFPYPQTLKTRTGVLEIDAMSLRVGSMYTFRGTAWAGKKSASTKQLVFIKQGDLPNVNIKCVTNCKGKMNPTSSFALQGKCTNCPDNIISYLLYKWELFEITNEDDLEVLISDLPDITSTGDKRAGLNFIPDVLEPGREYRLRLSIQPPSGSTGYSEYIFMTNLPPYNGTCTVSPFSGLAITTAFSIRCEDWLDEGSNVGRVAPGAYVDSPYLLYKVLQRPKGSKSYSLMYSGEINDIKDLVFGVGPVEFNHTFELKVQIVDKFGARAETDLEIEVLETVLEADDLDTLVGSNSSHLQQLIAAGDAKAATQLITAVLSVLTDQDNSTLTDDEVKELQTNLLEDLAKVSIWADTIEDLYSAASALSHATGGSAHEAALFNAALSMASMATRLESVSDDSPEEVMRTAEGLTDALGNLISQSEDIVNVALVGVSQVSESDTSTEEEEEVDEYAPGAIDPELEATILDEEKAKRALALESASYAAKTISGITQRTLNSVADVLCGQQVSGQPPAVMDTGTIKAEFYVEEAAKMAGRELKIAGGSFDLPSADLLFPNAGQNLKQKFYSFGSNPYAFDTSSPEVGTEGSLSLDFESADGDGKVSVANLSTPISIILDNGKTQLPSTELVFWNSTVHHKVEVLTNDTDLHLIVKPMNSSSATVYVRYGEQVNTTNYDYVFEIPRTLTKEEKWTDPAIREEARYSLTVPSGNESGAGLYFVAISLPRNLSIWEEQEDLPTADLPTVALVNDIEYVPTVDFTVYCAGCRYWDEKREGWTSDGCMPGPLTNRHYTQCLCTHLSDFASSFFVPPNSIDFSTVFTKFKNLGDNAAVFSTCFALFGVYLILLVWLRRKDKQDIIRWGVTPLADNKPHQKYYYQITVETGMRPGSGTSSKIGLILSGDLLDTGVRMLDDSKREVFARGSVCHFLLATDDHLGPLSYLKIWHDNSGEGDMAGWYLSKMAILDIQTGEQFFFICERWLAVEYDDGAVDRLIPIATKSDMMQFTQLFYSGSRDKLFDDHLWFSLFTRPTRSTFTRVQRLSCCLSLLYCSMIANAMFYRSEENVEKPSAVRLGPFVFSGQQIFVGFISALVVVPINVAIVQVFRKSKPSKKDTPNAALPEDAQQKLNELDNPSKKKKSDKNKESKQKKPSIKKKKADDDKRSSQTKKKIPEIIEPPPQYFESSTPQQVITQEQLALALAYKPQIAMEMIDGTEEFQCNASTETLAVDDIASTLTRSSSRESVYQLEDDDEDVKTEKSDKHVVKKKEEFMLPHWCVYIAWFLFAISCLVSAFFTILYSLEWGAEKANEWLTAMLLSFFNSVVIIQPVKVLVIVTLLSLIFKKPPKMEADTDVDSIEENKLSHDEEFLHKIGVTDGDLPFIRKAPTKEELEIARKRRFQEIRMYSVIRETVIYTIYVMVLLFLCYSNRDTLAFYVSKSIRDNFVRGDAGENTTLKLESLEKSTPGLFWDWMDKSVIPGLYGSTYYNGEPMHWRHSRFLADWNSYRVGPARLRQLRVKPDHCIAPKQTAHLVPECTRTYDSSDQEERSFFIGWKPPRNITYEIGKDPEFIPEDEEMPWKYQDALSLNGVPYPGKLALYSGGGYVAEFGVSMARAYEISKFLRDNNWYDELTRAIFLEFTVYNANSNLFSVTQILVELPTSGGGLPSHYVHTFRLYHYYGGAVIVSVLLQLLFVIYIIYFFVKLIMKIKKEGKKELASFWTVVEMITLFLAFTAVGLFAIRQIFIYFSLKEVKNKNEGKFVNFAHIAKWDELFGFVMAFLAFLAILRYMRLLRLSPRMCVFGLTMSAASSGLICFSIMFFILFFAFGQMGNILFGHTVQMYSNLMTTMETLYAMMLGSFEFQPLQEVNATLGPVFFVSYIVSMFFILSNMFITLISDAFGSVNNVTAEELGDGDTELVDFMMDRLKVYMSSFVGSNGGDMKKPQEILKAKDEPAETNPLDMIDSRIDRLLDYVTKNYGDIKDTSTDGQATDGTDVESVASPKPRSAPKLRTKSILLG